MIGGFRIYVYRRTVFFWNYVDTRPDAIVLAVSSSFDRKDNGDPPLVSFGVVGLD